MTTHLVIPDLQVHASLPGKPCPLDHFGWIGRYMVERRAGVIVQLGDWQDFDSLSSWSKGTLEHEGKRIQADLDAFHESMRLLMTPLQNVQKRHSAVLRDKMTVKTRIKEVYSPRLVALDGNHENRLDRFVQQNSEFHGFFDLSCLKREKNGWEVIPFLTPVIVDGISYCHYFPRGANGKVTQTKRGSPNAKTQLARERRSCTSGHLQGIDLAVHQLSDVRQYSIIAGSCYLHIDDYMTVQGCRFWKGLVVKHEVRNGEYDIMLVGLDYLCRKYEGMPLDKFLYEKYGDPYEKPSEDSTDQG